MSSDFLDDLIIVSREQQRKASEKDKREQVYLETAARNLLQTDDGRRVFFWIIDMTGVFTTSFTGNSTTFFLEGKRTVGLELYKLLMTAEPSALQILMDYKKNEEGNLHG